MNNDVRQMEEVKKWLQGNFFLYKNKEQKEDESLGCIPIEEVDELLKKCAYELGTKYEK